MMETSATPRAEPFADPAAGPPPAELAAFRADPGFVAAARDAAISAIGLYRGNRVVNRVMTDRGRVVFSHMALYLHFAPDDAGVGLTVGRLKDMCAGTGLCSPGRVEAMVALMRAGGYLGTAPHAADRRVRMLRPTDKLMTLSTERWHGILSALVPAFPEAAGAVAALADPAFLAAFYRYLGVQFSAGVRVIDRVPELGLFADRNAAVMIVLALALGGASGDPFPAAGPVPVSISALSRQFGVSRKHVATLLRDAERGDLIRRHGPDHVVLQPPVREGVLNFFARAFLFALHAGRAALAEVRGRAV